MSSKGNLRKLHLDDISKIKEGSEHIKFVDYNVNYNDENLKRKGFYLGDKPIWFSIDPPKCENINQHIYNGNGYQPIKEEPVDNNDIPIDNKEDEQETQKIIDIILNENPEYSVNEIKDAVKEVRRRSFQLRKRITNSFDRKRIIKQINNTVWEKARSSLKKRNKEKQIKCESTEDIDIFNSNEQSLDDADHKIKLIDLVVDVKTRLEQDRKLTLYNTHGISNRTPSQPQKQFYPYSENIKSSPKHQNPHRTINHKPQILCKSEERPLYNPPARPNHSYQRPQNYPYLQMMPVDYPPPYHPVPTNYPYPLYPPPQHQKSNFIPPYIPPPTYYMCPPYYPQYHQPGPPMINRSMSQRNRNPF